jgi:DNA polymerase-3 subunit gamma/tau
MLSDFKQETIGQIKNITQEKKISQEVQKEIKAEKNTVIQTFDQLLEICSKNKEIKLKYELEKNVYLVSFNKNRIEISFNDKLDKNFVKDLSLKLYEWTGERWIITFSKNKGDISVKEKEQNKKNELFNESKESELFKKVLEKFPDANLLDIIPKDKKDK